MAERISTQIEDSVVITAPLQRVWELVSTPGWWINEGEVVDHELQWEGELVTVLAPPLGEFTLRVEELRAPERVAFRWLGEAPQTLITFTLAPVEGGVEVRVVESDWDAVAPSDQVRTAQEETMSGWRRELAAATRRLAA